MSDSEQTTTDAIEPRTDVEFTSGGVRCSAWLYRPVQAGPYPVIVMGHGLGATREMRLAAYAERFAAAGYACLVFDYAHFGASDGEPRQLLDVRLQLRDWRAAVAYARTLDGVDPAKVVVWGSSFGGGHAISTAADDPGVAAAVAQCPFTDGLASSLAIAPAVSLKLTALALLDRLGSAFGRRPVMVATAGRPGTTALMTSADAYDGYVALMPPGGGIENAVAARVVLDVIRYTPGRRVARIASPMLFCVCESDSVAPARATLRHARRAPRGEIALFPEGHFEIYMGDAFERAVRTQLAFLQANVPANMRSAEPAKA